MRLLESVVVNANDAVLITKGEPIDEPGPRIIYANEAFTRMSGYSLEEVLGKTPRIVQGPNTERATLDKIRAALKTWQPVEVELINYHKNGSKFWVELSIVPVFDESGWCSHWVSIQRDVTERKRTEERLRLLESVVVNANDGVLITEADPIDEPGPRIIYANEAFTRMTGYSLEELLGKTPRILQGPKTNRVTLSNIRAALEIKQPVMVELINYRKDRSEFWVEMSLVPVTDQSGCYTHWVSLKRDITERKAAEVLRQSEERYALAVRGANDGLWDWNLIANNVYFSSRWKSMLGWFENEIGNSPNEWFSRVHPEDAEQVKAELAAHLQGLTPHFENEHRMLSKNRTYRWMLSRGTAVRDADGNAYRIVGSQTDITDRRLAEKQLIHNAFHDVLTELPNRALFRDRLALALDRAKRHEDYMFAVLFLDLDRFKVVNDSLGHTIGDQLLIAIACRLEACLRPTDMAARLGGDEFTILLEDIKDASDAICVAERIQEELTLPFQLGEQEVFTTASIGIALSASGYDQPEDILRDVDIAMYRAKSQGSARYEIFNTGMHTEAVARLQVETELRRAVERQEFRIHYQPIVALETGRIAGFEALVRWQHPIRGLVHPDEFIPVAAETGLSICIDWWVLAQACRQIHLWQKQFPDNLPLTVSVNLCSQQFRQTGLINHIEQILQETGLDAHSLKMEITENVIMENAESATTTLEQLRTLGIQLSIDDFGTGYSSLGRLHHFPINLLKIDRSFVSRIGVEQGNLEIAETIMTLAQKLGLDVTAEGVETAVQLQKLRELKCEYGQGYFFAQPLNTEAAEALLMVQPQW